MNLISSLVKAVLVVTSVASSTFTPTNAEAQAGLLGDALAAVDKTVSTTLTKLGLENVPDIMMVASQTPVQAEMDAIFISISKTDPNYKSKVVAALKQMCTTKFQDILNECDSNPSEHEGCRCHFTSMELVIKKPSLQLLETLVSNIPLIDALFSFVSDFIAAQVLDTANAEPGVTDVQAPQVWEHDQTLGEGTVIGSIDTGVFLKHESLEDRYRSYKGWYNPYDESMSQPQDDHGHGTHTMGIAVGSNGIGVAPGAEWIACMGCRSNGCWKSALIACMDFMACPHDYWSPQSNSDCNAAPDVVTNSWGTSYGDTSYTCAMKTWHALDMISVFAIGNSGPSCQTVVSPGDYTTVIGVGSIDATNGDRLVDRSSRGPNYQGHTKPDVVAPGANIRSAGIASDTSYVYKSGTSMAAPHTAGIALLLKSKNKELNVDDVKELLQANADRELASDISTCTPSSSYPNNGYGAGLIKGYQAMTSV